MIFHAFRPLPLSLGSKHVLRMKADPIAALYLTSAILHRAWMPLPPLLQVWLTGPAMEIIGTMSDQGTKLKYHDCMPELPLMLVNM